MSEKIESNLNLPDVAQGQSAESLERLEERERILTLLRDFYQEQQKNMAVHREIGELAEKLKGMVGKANSFMDKYFPGVIETQIKEEYIFKNNRNEITQLWKHGKEDGIAAIQEIIKNLEEILQRKLFGEELSQEKQKDKEQIIELIENLKEIDDKINETVRKLWEIREKIVKELILTVPEFADFKDAELSRHYENKGLYNLDSEIWAEKIFKTEEGRQKKILFFKADDWDINKALKDLTENFNITEQELLEFSLEQAVALKRLREAVEVYKQEAEGIKQAFMELDGHEISESGAENITTELIRGRVRFLYEKSGLPKVHKARITQEIMDGTFTLTL